MMAALLLVAMSLMQHVTPPLRSVDKGAQSAIEAARQVVARDADQWMEVWRAHSPNRPPPSVDFAREMVVGVFVGTRQTAGFAVEIPGYRDLGSALIVQYRETVPSRDAMTAQVLTSPYHLVVVPRRTGDVKFEKIP